MIHLFVGAHPDDIELACGGTILKYKELGDTAFILILTKGKGRKGNRVKEQYTAFKELEVKGEVLDFKDGFVTADRKSIDLLEQYIIKISPDMVYTHCPEDFHQDHKAVSQMVRAINRNKDFGLAYFPSVDVTADFKANLFVDIDKYWHRKRDILNIFASQKDRWYIEMEETGFSTPFARHVERFYLEFIKL